MLQKSTLQTLLLAALLSLALTQPVRAETTASFAAEPFPLPEIVPDGTTIRIDGTENMSVINQILKQRFEEKFPGADVEIRAQGTDAAIRELLDDEIDLAAIARPLTAEEKAQGLIEIPLSQEQIAIIVGRENPFDGSLTVKQLEGIFRGDITDWEQLGREPGAIEILDRPETSDTRRILRRYAFFQDGDLMTGENVLTVDSTADVIRTLGRNGIGYAIASELLNQKKAKTVKIAVLQETLPGDAIYPYAQPRGYAYKESPNSAAQSFLGYATADSGQDAVAAAKVAEAKAVVAPPKPIAPVISQVDTPGRTDGSGQAIKFWLWLLAPLALIGLLLQWIFRWVRGKQPAPTQPAAPVTETRAELMTPPAEPIQTLEATIVETPAEVAKPADEAKPAVAEAALDGVVAGTIAAITDAVKPKAGPRKLYDEAVKLLGVGRAAEALPNLDEAVELQPEFVEAWAERGMALFRLQRFEDALTSFDRAISLNESLPIAWLGKGKTLFSLARYEEASTSFDRALAIQPELPEALIGRGNTLIKLGQPKAALPIFEQALALQPGSVEALMGRETVLELQRAEAPAVESPATPPEIVRDAEPVSEAIVVDAGLPPVEAEPVMTSIVEAATVISEPEMPPMPAAETEAAIVEVPPVSAPTIPVDFAPPEFTIATVKQTLTDHLAQRGLSLSSATPNELYGALATSICKQLLLQPTPETTVIHPDARLIGELSAEYLPGPHLENSLLSQGLLESMRQALQESGISLAELVAQEEEPGLGKGGLGRLMVCYLDALATQEIPAIGYGIRYEYGIFDQEIQDGWQVEIPDTWLQSGNPWEVQRPEGTVQVGFGGRTEAYVDEQSRYRVRWVPAEVVTGFLYDTPIPGYRSRMVNLMRLWQADASNLCKVLYPVDVEQQGRELRLRQQFFLISCSLQDAIRLHRKAGRPIATLAQHFSLQLNDTDTTLAVAELMRLLVDEHGVEWNQAWEITRSTLAYTNHSLMPETLDDLWSIPLMQGLLPRHLELIYEINARFLEEIRAHYPGDVERLSRMSLIDETGDRHIRLTNLACVGTHAINGVSPLHTRLLEQKILPDFYELYPEKFSNKTNGVTPRRFLLLSNPRLAELITQRIGDGWVKNLEVLNRLEGLADDAGFRHDWRQTKQAAKQDLASLIYRQLGIEVDVNSLFDVQAMVMHEYKRQHLNALHILTLYNRIKANPDQDILPRTFIFAGKAAPDYETAKRMIKLINAIAALVNSDPDVRGRLKVVFLPDLNIKLAQKIYPAIDLAEHISVAGTEACDTGNLIAALNGALVIGTPDGSNLELQQAVGAENFFQFGLTAPEAAERAINYQPLDVYNANPELKGAIDLLTSGVLAQGDTELFRPLVNLLLYSDKYLLTADYQSYLECQERVSQTYRDGERWVRMSIFNTARIGKFSADRAIREYCQDIWQVRPVAQPSTVA